MLQIDGIRLVAYLRLWIDCRFQRICQANEFVNDRPVDAGRIGTLVHGSRSHLSIKLNLLFNTKSTRLLSGTTILLHTFIIHMTTKAMMMSKRKEKSSLSTVIHSHRDIKMTMAVLAVVSSYSLQGACSLPGPRNLRRRIVCIFFCIYFCFRFRH